MGAQNEAVIKAKLKELRVYVTTSQDPPAETAAPAQPGDAAAPAVKPDSQPEAAPAPK
jgi:hypothetical protein